jgi:hypothetical protein
MDQHPKRPLVVMMAKDKGEQRGVMQKNKNANAQNGMHQE